MPPISSRLRPPLTLGSIPKLNLMPDVGLTTATEPLAAKARVVIKYSVEVEGLPVYQESYDVEKLSEEVRQNRELAQALWFRRIECVLESRHREAFSATLKGCLADGSCSFRADSSQAGQAAKAG